MAFGTYDGVVANASTTLNATATIISTCTSGAAAQITMNAGAYEGSGSTDVPVRRMTAGASEYLVYQVYSDVSRKQFGEILTPQVFHLLELAPLKPLQFMVAFLQRK
jgi:spore coat protein U-like protein